MSEELNKKEFDYTIGIFDVICRDIRKKIKEQTQSEGVYGLGVYTDRYCENELMTLPMKTTEERMNIARYFEGVNFVFPVDSRDEQKIEDAARSAYLNYIEEQKKKNEDKKYKAGFVIGSFDVFHAGHLENLMLAKEMCENLVVVLKTDERIFKNKHKVPKQSTAERASILSMLKIIDKITYMDIDTTRRDVVEDVKSKYKEIQSKDIVAIFGSDLQEKEEPYIDKDWKDINVVFTNRDPQKMKIVSSSNYQRECDLKGGIENLEKKESESIR